eukprot:PhM_4_TR2447/c2_g1_i3/m.12572
MSHFWNVVRFVSLFGMFCFAATTGGSWFLSVLFPNGGTLSVVVKTEQTNETKTNNNFTHNPRIHTTQRPTNNARQINFTGDAILIVGDSIARYLFMGMRARAETLGYVGDDSKVPSHPPLDSYRRGWELYAHVATAYLRHPTRNTSLHLRYERVQYL